MIFVPPEHSAFEALPRRHQAWIYRHHLGWTAKAIADEFGISKTTVWKWTMPGAYEREDARKAAYRQTERGKMAARDYDRRYRESGRRAEVRARALEDLA